MSLEDDIKDSFKADTESIIAENYHRLEGLFKYHDDGTISLSSQLTEAHGRIKMLVYIIAQRLMFEANDAESATLDYDFFYQLFDVKENTVQKWAQLLRDDGLIKTDDGQHSLVPENLPTAIDLIDEELE